MSECKVRSPALNCDNTTSFLKIYFDFQHTCSISKSHIPRGAIPAPLLVSCRSDCRSALKGAGWQVNVLHALTTPVWWCTQMDKGALFGQHSTDLGQRTLSFWRVFFPFFWRTCTRVPGVMNVVTQILTAGNIQAHRGCRLLFWRS